MKERAEVNDFNLGEDKASPC